ncbi:hypothetical protein DSM106972_086330 [Dulcicalothrix desertica PCC 7102]|uniref:Uncharacterized protein n=1 Tax=Dulcicalothrix desertica PCC 7102 TaxID=232991 RepID=A0A3S1BXS6_9CYAN|nr:aminoglycoside phosphotransferase [Dulcicalothrix desertica]RUS96610.1 hypothetical protein DSM106972_086330 [Dulcicalothrix desertica PCC 7102]TWH43864.1 hypothetical protein CAL7102_07612 [Dulcicalothrix desertica PCC 7102]
MQSIQHLLTTAIVVLCVTMTTTIVLDSCISLTQLWNNVAANKEMNFQRIYPQPDNANKPEPQLAATESTTISTAASDLSVPTMPDNTDVESLQLLIQKLPQSRIRTAARRLGIKDKVDGSYQKLGILRAQLQEKLKYQPSEVEQVLSSIAATTSISRQKQLC